MVYPEQFEWKLGVDKIRAIIKSKCKGEEGKKAVDSLAINYKLAEIEMQLQLTDEMKSICMLKQTYPAETYNTTNEATNNLKVDGLIVDIEGWVVIKNLLQKLGTQIKFLQQLEPSEYKYLQKLSKKIVFPKYVLSRIDNIISKKGTIKDHASPTLSGIRKNLEVSRKQASQQLNKMLLKIRSEGWLSSDLSATHVNGRVVLPIDSTHKRKLRGIVHDESATGKTSYIEPEDVLVKNNEIKTLELSEEREIKIILANLTKELRPYTSEIEASEQLIIELDLIRAKALFAIDINGIKPGLHNGPTLEIVRGKHPLLIYNYKNSTKKVIPLDVTLNESQRIMIISGPNAGGKSVALQTVALLQYMTQCGLLVPVGGSSSIGIFQNIFIDFGDEQSIENDLSTYSSHLRNMKFFLKNANENTLILIDEFGSGTDPSLGGAIAEGILNKLIKTDCKGIITTHYTNLKLYASDNQGVENAAMLIDNTEMSPLYQLQTGIPGSSYAIEIAHRAGLPEDVIEYAKNASGNLQADFDKHLRKVLRDKKYWEHKRSSIKHKEKKLEHIQTDYIEKLEKIKNKENQILQKAYAESQILIKDINKKLEQTIRNIRESNADKEKTKETRKHLQDYTKNVEKRLKSPKGNQELSLEINSVNKNIEQRNNKQEDSSKKPEYVHINPSAIHIGSKVKLKGQDGIGEVNDIGEKNVVVSFGQIYMSVEVSKLEKVSKEEYKSYRKSTLNTGNEYLDYQSNLKEFKPYLDLRGFNTQEALIEVSELVDKAIVLNVRELKILHGKGNGILRQNIREYLKKLEEVKAYNDEDVRFGGAGITIVLLK